MIWDFWGWRSEEPKYIEKRNTGVVLYTKPLRMWLFPLKLPMFHRRITPLGIFTHRRK